MLHGSRRLHNTTTALLEMHHSWLEILESGNAAGVLMLDLSSAFDLVDHGLLIQKLDIMGFKPDAVGWIRSYLDNRSQCVHIDGQLSDMLLVPTGVPQGSVLGALLYIL